MVGAPVSESGYSIAEPVGVPPRRFSARAKIVVTLTPSASAIEATASTPRRRLALSVLRTVLRPRPVRSTRVSIETCWMTRSDRSSAATAAFRPFDGFLSMVDMPLMLPYAT
nr:MAG TPA: hypothetical protein [Siphoviridae sp. ctvS314]